MARAITIGPSAPGTARARPRAVKAPKPTIAASSSATSHRLSESKIAWITYPTAVSCRNDRRTAIPRCRLQVGLPPQRSSRRDRHESE